MKAEIIAIGTELLLGEVVNTNTTMIAQKLATIGIDVYHQQVVGDNPKRLTHYFLNSLADNDIVIMTGGLGPTQDDVTKEVVAKALGETLVSDNDAKARIDDYFQKLGVVMTKNNLKQSLYISNGEPVANRTGLAVGCWYEYEHKLVILLPGPPRECEAMMDDLLPKLETRTSHRLASKTLRFFGITESELTDRLDNLIKNQQNPTIGTYAKGNEVTIRLTAQAKTKADAEKRITPVATHIKHVLSQYYYGEGEDGSLMQSLVQLCQQNHITLTAAESLTCGLFQATLGTIAGASRVFLGGYVTYSAAMKEALGVPHSLIAKYGVVSEACARAMAEKAKAKAHTDYAVSFTGVAGPDSLEGHPAGDFWVGVSGPYRTRAYLLHYPYRDRQFVRESAVYAGTAALFQMIQGDVAAKD